VSDLLLALLGLALFAAFVGYLALSIAEIPLLLIVGAVIAMAGYDFWAELRRG
jgi:hypothetical protein